MTNELGRLEAKMSGSVTPGPLRRVLDSIDDLNVALEGLWGGEQTLRLDDAVYLWQVMTEERKKIASHETMLESLVINLMGDKKQVDSKMGRLTTHTSSKKETWDTSLLVPAIAQAAVTEIRVNDDGEPLSEVEAVVQAILSCASVGYFRLGKLEEYGIDGKKYRDVEWGRKRVQITPIQSED